MKINVLSLAATTVSLFFMLICFVNLPNSEAQSPRCEAPAWRLVYQHDINGKPLQGSKTELFDAVRRGDSIRFAWGATFPTTPAVSVEHSAEPVFTTIVNGQELFVQLPEHIAQQGYGNIEKSRFDKPAVMWRGLMGTDGTFDAVWIDRATGETVQRKPQRAQIAWFTLSPSPQCENRKPLKLTVPNGVILDKKQTNNLR